MKKLLIFTLALGLLGFSILFFLQANPSGEKQKIETMSAGADAEIDVAEELRRDEQDAKSLAAGFQKIVRTQMKTERTDLSGRLNAVFGTSPLGQELTNLFQNPDAMTSERMEAVMAGDPAAAMDVLSEALAKVQSSDQTIPRDLLLRWSTRIPGEDDRKIQLWQREAKRRESGSEDRLLCHRMLLSHLPTEDEALELTVTVAQTDPNNAQVEKDLIAQFAVRYPGHESRLIHILHPEAQEAVQAVEKPGVSR